jgi:hypothetical protein
MMASLPGYMYAAGNDSLYIDLYAASTAQITLSGNRNITVEQETRYPWDEHIHITDTLQQAAAFAIHVRIPGWARNEPVPSDRDGNEWKPVEPVGPYGIAKDKYNPVNFKPVTTNAVRVEVTLQPGWTAGVNEWKVK